MGEVPEDQRAVRPLVGLAAMVEAWATLLGVQALAGVWAALLGVQAWAGMWVVLLGAPHSRVIQRWDRLG